MIGTGTHRAAPSTAAASPTGLSPVDSVTVLPRQLEAQQAFVRRPEAARHERAVDVRQRLGQQDAGGFPASRYSAWPPSRCHPCAARWGELHPIM